MCLQILPSKPNPNDGRMAMFESMSRGNIECARFFRWTWCIIWGAITVIADSKKSAV